MYMIKTALSAILLLLSFKGSAQIYLNPGVDTSLQKVKTALHFYDDYLLSFKGKKLPDMAKYWPAVELTKRTVPDQLIYAIDDSSPLYASGYSTTILYARPTEKYVHFKTQFSYADSLKQVMTMAVINSYVGFNDKGRPYLINPLTINMTNWRTSSRGNVVFHYPPYHKFDAKRADSLIKEIGSLEKEWGLKPHAIQYYLANDHDELYRLKGFDFAVGMGNENKPSGKADEKDNQVFCGGLGENYFHEVVHLYLNRLFTDSPLQEGLAVFYGGSMGRPVKWHLKRVNQYLLAHPNVDLTDIDNFWYTDPYTNPGSAIQGMLCAMVYQKDGLAGLKRLMRYTSYTDIFEKEFHISKAQVNGFIRKMVREQAGE